MVKNMSFNYTPPPLEVIRTGQIASCIVCATLFFVPRVKLGVTIGAVGLAAIHIWVATHAGGDLGGISVITEGPVWATIGAGVGAVASFISQTFWRLLRKSYDSQSAPAEMKEHKDT